MGEAVVLAAGSSHVEVGGETGAEAPNTLVGRVMQAVHLVDATATVSRPGR